MAPSSSRLGRPSRRAARFGPAALALLALNACAGPPPARAPHAAPLAGAPAEAGRAACQVASPAAPAAPAAPGDAQAGPGGEGASAAEAPPRAPAAGDALAARTPPRAYELDPPPPDDWRKPAGAIGLAVGTTLVAMGVAATLRISKVNKEFRSSNEFLKYESGLPAGVGMCDAADQGIASSAPDAASPTLVRTRCHTRSDWKVVQPLGFIGGGLLIAGGAALLVSSAVAPRRAEEARAGKLRLSFAPTWGPRSAGATLGGTW